MWEVFLKGGSVMYAILAVSVLGVAVIVERLIYFARNRNDDTALLERIEEALARGDLREARSQLARARGPVQRVVSACLGKWREGLESIAEAANFEGNRVVDDLEKHLRVLAIIAQGAPLLGLLGTVTGMIRTFMEIEGAGGEVNVTSLAGGIWEALLTTAFGLVVAIPALFAYHYFEAKVERYARLIRDAAERVSAVRRKGTRT